MWSTRVATDGRLGETAGQFGRESFICTSLMPVPGIHGWRNCSRRGVCTLLTTFAP